MLNPSHHSQSPEIGHWRDRLESCPECHLDLVQPVGYEALWADRWLVSLECPSCRWSHEQVFPHAALRRFEEYLDAIDDRLWNELNRLEKTRHKDEVAAFACALADDLILPEDF